MSEEQQPTTNVQITMTVSPNNNTASTTTTTTTALLTLLHQYHTLHTSASTSLKSSLWQITKARRGRGYQTSGGGSFSCSEYSVEGVREELCATALLSLEEGRSSSRRKEDNEPELIDENNDNDINNDDNSISADKKNCDNYSADMKNNMMLHFDGMEGAKRQAAAAAAAAKVDAVAEAMTNNDTNNNFETTTNNNNNQEGLRRRRNMGSNDHSTNNESTKWTLEEGHLEEEVSSSRDTVDKQTSSYTDPIHLFGVPPPALHMAQSNSRDALAYYVEVANLARQIMTIVVEESGKTC